MVTRRSFIAAGAVTAATTLSGCYCKQYVSEIDRSDLRTFSTKMNGFYPLAPKRINSSVKSVDKIIDVHTHMFNASDLQVAGFLRGSVAYTVARDNPKLQRIIQGLAPCVELLGNILSISAKAEFDILQNVTQGSSTMTKQTLQSATGLLEQKSIDHRSDAAELFVERVNRTRLKKDIDAYLASDAKLKTLSGSGSFDTFELDSVKAVFNHDANYQSLKSNTKTAGISFWGVIEFIGILLSHRYSNLGLYKEKFTEGRNSLGIEKCYTALVDFDYWIGDCVHTKSRLEDQMLLNELISNLSDGYVTPLMAYNPWTDIENNDASLYMVEEALKERGFAGVKIYPAMGYFPSGNQAMADRLEGRLPNDLSRVDEQLNKLYEICTCLGVPVMSHSNHSLGRLPSNDVLGGPLGWDHYLSNTQNTNTKINLGHFGSEENDEGWRQSFIDLMNKPTGTNVYGDLSYWIKSIQGNYKFIQDFVPLLSKRLNNGEIVADRLMFGTDWSMISREKNWESYATAFHSALKKNNVDPMIMEKLFSGNAEKLFSRNRNHAQCALKKVN